MAWVVRGNTKVHKTANNNDSHALVMQIRLLKVGQNRVFKTSFPRTGGRLGRNLIYATYCHQPLPTCTIWGPYDLRWARSGIHHKDVEIPVYAYFSLIPHLKRSRLIYRFAYLTPTDNALLSRGPVAILKWTDFSIAVVVQCNYIKSAKTDSNL